MAAIGKVAAVFTASTSGLTSGVKSAQASLSSLEASTRSLSSGMRGLLALELGGYFASFAASASRAVSSLVNMGQAQADVIDDTSKLADRLGMTYAELAGLSYAGELAGVSLEQIGAAATKADVAFARAAGGSKTAVAAFDSLGLSVEQLNGLSSADRFDAIASAIAALPTEAERAAAAVQLFGRSGAELLPLFNSGADAIAAARAEAESFGLTLTNAQGQNVEAMNDSFTRAQKAITGVVQQIVAYLAPAVEAVTTQFSNLVGSVGGANIGQAIGDALLQGAVFLAGVGDYIIANLSGVWGFASQVGGQWNVVVDIFNRAASFLSGVFNAAQAGLGTIILGFSAAFQGLAEIAQSIGQYLGFDTASIDAVVAGAQAFNDQIQSGINENLAASQAGFAAAFGPSQAAAAGQAIAGPLTTSLQAAQARAEEAANQIDQATSTPIDVKQSVELSGVNEAIKGIDSRSKEGVAEMFRIMRGDSGNVQEQQLGVLEQIAENTSGLGEEYTFAIEGG